MDFKQKRLIQKEIKTNYESLSTAQGFSEKRSIQKSIKELYSKLNVKVEVQDFTKELQKIKDVLSSPASTLSDYLSIKDEIEIVESNEKDLSTNQLYLDSIEFLTKLTSVDMDSVDSSMTQNKTIEIDGMEIVIESPKGTIRKGISEDGTKWENELQDDYGYFPNTVGADGDEIDVFVTNQEEAMNRPVFVLYQETIDGNFDEHKVILGAETLSDAKSIYYRNYGLDYTNSGEWESFDFDDLLIELEVMSEDNENRMMDIPKSGQSLFGDAL